MRVLTPVRRVDMNDSPFAVVQLAEGAGGGAGPCRIVGVGDYRPQAHLVDQIVHCLGGFGPVHPRIAAGRRDITFALPRGVI